MKKFSGQQPSFGFNAGLLGIFSLVFAGMLALSAWRPLADPDFWWHLKTGELIVEGRALLAADPFNFTSKAFIADHQERLVLNAYWLWQVTAYGFYRLCGFSGIKLLNCLTLVATYAAIGWAMFRYRLRLTLALPLLGTSLFLYSQLYQLERPQVMSFLCATLVVILCLDIRRGARPSFWLFPLMAVWSNIHGGVVVGTALLGVFAVGSAWDCRRDRRRLTNILLWCAGGMLASLASPVNFGIYQWALSMPASDGSRAIKEFASPFGVVVQSPWVCGGFLLLLTAHIAALCVNWRRRPLADWLLSAFCLALGSMYMRNLAFVAVALVPMTACLLAEAFPSSRIAWIRVERSVALAVIVMLLAANLATMKQGKAWRKEAWAEIDTAMNPYAVAEFLKSASLQGNLFNEYDWGGYLIWKLYPDCKFFIDGRNFNRAVLEDYLKILKASLEEENGVPEYKQILERYRIDYVVQPNQMKSGLVQKIMKYLLTEPGWQPIYLDGQAFVLAKINANTANAVRRYGIDKKVFLDRLLIYSNNAVNTYPDNAYCYLFRGELLGYIGRYDAAERDFVTVQQLEPGNAELPDKLTQLRKLREQAKNQRAGGPEG